MVWNETKEDTDCNGPAEKVKDVVAVLVVLVGLGHRLCGSATKGHQRYKGRSREDERKGDWA